jgi:hypothetical protein
MLVEQSTEPLAPLDGVRLARRRLGNGRRGAGLAERTVWPMAVVVVLVLAEHSGAMPQIGDQDAVAELGRLVPTKRSAIPLAAVLGRAT